MFLMHQIMLLLACLIPNATLTHPPIRRACVGPNVPEHHQILQSDLDFFMIMLGLRP